MSEVRVLARVAMDDMFPTASWSTAFPKFVWAIDAEDVNKLDRDIELVDKADHDKRVAELEAELAACKEIAQHNANCAGQLEAELATEKARADTAVGDANEAEAELAEADDLILFLAKVYCEMDRIRYETMSVPEGEIVDFMISNWPVVQGTANQIRLMRLGEMPYDSGKLAAAIDACLARHGDKS